MSTLDFRPRDSGAPDNTFPRFHVRAEQNNFKTQLEGRAIFEDREFVEIICPGQMKSIPIEPVNEDHKARWPAQYKAFKDGLAMPDEGTPLEQWPLMTPAQVQNFKAANIRTVEQMAGLDDSVLQNIGLGGREIRQRARDFLESAASSAPLERERARADAAEGEVALLKNQMQDLMDRVAQMETKRGTAE
jgi:hypothetical protein